MGMPDVYVIMKYIWRGVLHHLLGTGISVFAILLILIASFFSPKFRKFIQGFLLHPLFASLITLLIIVTGMVGSIFSPEIRKSIPFGTDPLSEPARWFWQLALISSITYFFREHAAAQAQEDARKEILSKANEFKGLIRTMPPSNFLAIFSDFYDSAEKIASESRSGMGRETLQKSIRHILRIVAALAQTFDGSHPNAEYAANIMLFVPSKGVNPEKFESVSKNLIFCDEAVSFENLYGALQLEVELSATALDLNVPPDPSMAPIALPLPKNKKVNDLYKVFPGAPLAFFEKELDGYSDTTSLAKWCEDFGDFTGETVGKIRAHFENSKVRSFVSIPLFPILAEGGDDEESDPVAVLNIHSSRQGLLKGENEPATHFVSLIRPFQVFLVQLLERLNAAASGQCQPGNSGLNGNCELEESQKVM